MAATSTDRAGSKRTREVALVCPACRMEFALEVGETIEVLAYEANCPTCGSATANFKIVCPHCGYVLLERTDVSSYVGRIK